jgi:hypothetical protein
VKVKMVLKDMGARKNDVKMQIVQDNSLACSKIKL